MNQDKIMNEIIPAYKVYRNEVIEGNITIDHDIELFMQLIDSRLDEIYNIWRMLQHHTLNSELTITKDQESIKKLRDELLDALAKDMKLPKEMFISENSSYLKRSYVVCGKPFASPGKWTELYVSGCKPYDVSVFTTTGSIDLATRFTHPEAEEAKEILNKKGSCLMKWFIKEI